MRFTRILAHRFGPLADIDTGPEPLPGLVVVLGPNEAGKTAFHGVLSSLVYGFYPATRDQHPFTPWSGGDIEIAGEFVLDGGVRSEIHRRLLSSPRGQLVHDGVVEVVDNRNLPCARHVDRGIYRQVYGISAAEMAAVESGAWEAVRDQLVVGMGSQDLRPPREVTEELRTRADRLWRPDNRGRPRHREMRASLAELRARKENARATDRELREVLERISALEEELNGLRLRSRDAGVRIERLRGLVPYRMRLQRLDELEAAVGDPGALEALPREPGARLRELRARAAALREGLAEVEGLDGKIREVASALIEGLPANNDGLVELCTRIRSLPSEHLREAGFHLGEERRRLEGLREHLDGLRARELPPPPPLPAFALSGAVGALPLLGIGIATARPLLSLSAIGLLLVTIPSLVRYGVAASRRKGLQEARGSEVDELERRCSDSEDRLRERGAALQRILAPLGLPGELFGPASPLPVALLLQDLETLARLAEEREKRLRSLRAVDPLGQLEDFEESGESGGEEEADWIRRECESTARRVEELIHALRQAGGDGTPDGVAAVEERMRDGERLQRFREELEREAGELSELRERIRHAEREGEEWLDIPRRLAAEESAKAEIDREIEEVREERARLKERGEQLSREETVDLVDGRIAEVREALLEVERERDRLVVLACMLERAEARFRSRNQPDLLQKAEGYLGRITAGRYRKILLGGETPNDFQLHAPHLPRPAPVDPPVSTGTREQVYLSLRLAIVDHLDRGRETLPLLLDEVLMTWDPERRARSLDLMAEASRERQIFLFTCHPHVAAEVSERAGRVLTLTEPSPV